MEEVFWPLPKGNDSVKKTQSLVGMYVYLHVLNVDYPAERGSILESLLHS